MNQLLTCQQMRLHELLDGPLPDEIERWTLDHLDRCSSCRERLEYLAGMPQWWTETHQFLQPTDQEEIPHFGKELSATHATFTEQTDCPSIDLIRPLLGPSDDPQSLGRLGHYEVRSWIGAGATGIVMKAFDPRLHRFVAIKVLTPALLHNEAARLRFEREGRAMAAVVHPHVVPVYAVDEYRGVPYIVMQLVTGGSLQRRIDSHGPLGVCETVRIALQTARGLSAAHDQGLVHRDIKPANILLESQVERVVVTDFSLARVADEAQLTLSGIIAGTPPYMAPEQARGETLDARSDLFSLGSVIYAMITGRPPFWSEGVLGTLRQVCEQEPVPIRVANPRIPEWLELLIAKLHAKDPARRFHSAAELAGFLEQELAHLQNPTTIGTPLRPWIDHVAPIPPRRRTWSAHTWSTRSWPIAATALTFTLGIAIAANHLWKDTPLSHDHRDQSALLHESQNLPANSQAHSVQARTFDEMWYATRDLLPLEASFNQIEASFQTPVLRNSAYRWRSEIDRLAQDIARLEQMDRPTDVSGGALSRSPQP